MFACTTMSDPRSIMQQWLDSPYVDEATKDELRAISHDDTEVTERFYKSLEFGTAGLRGIIAAGTNRMNIYTVRQATQGMAEYVKSKGPEAMEAGVAIAFDCRIMSKEFAVAAAEVLNGNGIKVYTFEELRPTPELSYAVRALKTAAGIMITASHNPKEYNGYKAYGSDGAQFGYDDANMVYDAMNAITDFGQIKLMSAEEATAKGLLVMLGEEMDKAYIDNAKAQAVNPAVMEDMADQVTIIYTPLHGCGNIPVRRALKELGFTKVHVVKEQELPDGNFPTVKSPNPEVPSAFDLAREMDKGIDADLIIGTDPDSDRMGMIVKDPNGQQTVLTGNQAGALLLDYIVRNSVDSPNPPQKPFAVSTIVTSRLARKICDTYGVNYYECLTGFKWICNQVRIHDEEGDETFLFGFEESFGYTKGTNVRDKDAVIAVTLAAEMTCYYKKLGKTLYDAVQELYDRYGYFADGISNFVREGKAGAEQIQRAMKSLREQGVNTFGKYKAESVEDFSTSIRTNLVDGSTSPIDIPKSNVLRYSINDDIWFAVRPSGTEPKIKIYYGVRSGVSMDEAKALLADVQQDVLDTFEPLLV